MEDWALPFNRVLFLKFLSLIAAGKIKEAHIHQVSLAVFTGAVTDMYNQLHSNTSALETNAWKDAETEVKLGEKLKSEEKTKPRAQLTDELKM